MRVNLGENQHGQQSVDQSPVEGKEGDSDITIQAQLGRRRESQIES